MAKEKTKDLFSNIAYASVTESAANTLTFAEINTGVSVHQKIAWIISRISWHIPDSELDSMAAQSDAMDMGLTLSDKVDSLSDLSDPALLSRNGLYLYQMGTPATGLLMQQPIERDYSSLPGGGLIITPKPLYAALKCTGFAAAATVSCRIYYTIKELAADEFWELVQASRIVT